MQQVIVQGDKGDWGGKSKGRQEKRKSVQIIVTLGHDSEGNGADDRGGHSPGPVLSWSPTVLSGCSSNFDLESAAADKPLECWKGQEALAKALPKLVEKACDL